MDDETRAHLEAMEARLMTRMNDNQEKLIERVRGVETSIALLAELARSANTLMSSLVGTHTDLVRRVTDLEKK